MSMVPFSQKQMQTLTWWCRRSQYALREAIICDGAVRSGKTLCLGISFFAWAFYRFDGADFALCGRTIRALRRNLLNPVLPLLRQLGFTFRERAAENLFLVYKEGRCNRFYLFGGKDEASCTLIQGCTLAGVLLDEVALMPRSFVEQALARCSVEGSKFWFSCNPEHPQHWFYQEWIQKSKQRNALYLHFTMEDNPSLSQEMIARYHRLYTGAFYERFVLGRWTAPFGAVYPFMAEKDRFCPPPDPPFSEFALSGDYGTRNPCSFGLWGRKDGIWYRLREYYYDARAEQNPRTDEEHYQALRELVGGNPLRCAVIDPSAASFLELLRRKGEFPVLPAQNQVVDGIRQTASALKQGRIRICNTCKDAMREFSVYRWDERGGRDAPLKQNDHAMDDIRYFVSTVLQGEPSPCYALAASREAARFDFLGEPSKGYPEFEKGGAYDL
ncbi:MAG: PBSX family phage terminase large subunit [Clostridiales bacterium]|jgi:PBSX family phage terminase large subunit|nr:PBSX family phage terminase large subunit [Clostridiales bacterium]